MCPNNFLYTIMQSFTLQEQFRKRSQSAIVRPPKSNPEQENFNSTPDNLQAVATNNNNDYVLNVTRKELAYSYQDISDSVSAFNLVNDYEDKEESNEDCEQPSKMAKTGGFNWRLAYHPKCIVLGLAIMTYSSGMAVAYYSIPPLGRDTGQMTCSTVSNSGFCITLFGDL